MGISGWFTSPNYPCNEYQNWLTCNYTITVTEGKFVRLTVLEFNVEEDYDNVTVSMNIHHPRLSECIN